MTTTFFAAGSEVLAPGQDGYAEVAATMFASGTPDLVVRPRDAAGVAAALRHAAGADLPLSVRSGGHSPAGFGTHTSGMVIDLRRFSVVRILDHGSRRVRIGAGATWGAVAGTLGQAGLALTAGDTASVGVGGLMLGGGIGWLVRKYGLAIDNMAARPRRDRRGPGRTLRRRAGGGRHAARRPRRDAQHLLPVPGR